VACLQEFSDVLAWYNNPRKFQCVYEPSSISKVTKGFLIEALHDNEMHPDHLIHMRPNYLILARFLSFERERWQA
jgi:hypothetical protein